MNLSAKIYHIFFWQDVGYHQFKFNPRSLLDDFVLVVSSFLPALHSLTDPLHGRKYEPVLGKNIPCITKPFTRLPHF